MIRAVSTTIRRGSRDWLPRLTYLYCLREIGKVDAFLANVHFTGDPHSPTTRQEWYEGIRTVSKELGIAGPVLYSVSVFLETAR